MIDTSAIAAIRFDELEAGLLERLIEADPVRLVAAVTRVEATCVIEGRKRDVGRRVLGHRGAGRRLRHKAGHDRSQ